MEHDERAASAPRLGLSSGHERAGQSATPQRLLDPHRLQFAIAAPDDAGDASHDPTVIPPGEDRELLLPADSGSRCCGCRHVRFEQRNISRGG